MSLVPTTLELPPRRMPMTPLTPSRPPPTERLRKTWSSTRYRLLLDVQVPRATTVAWHLLHLPSLFTIVMVILIIHDMC
jgi:hypothetical protein